MDEDMGSIFLVTEGFAADAREDGQEAEETWRQVVFGKSGGFEALQQLEDAHGGDVEADFLKPGRPGIVQQFESIGLPVLEVFAPFLLGQPVQVTTKFPTGEILLVETKVGVAGKEF